MPSMRARPARSDGRPSGRTRTYSSGSSDRVTCMLPLPLQHVRLRRPWPKLCAPTATPTLLTSSDAVALALCDGLHQAPGEACPSALGLSASHMRCSNSSSRNERCPTLCSKWMITVTASAGLYPQE